MVRKKSFAVAEKEFLSLVGDAPIVLLERVDRMRQLETSSFQSPSLLRCTEFPCKSDCTSIENRGTFTIFSVYPTERAEHAIGPLTSGLRHEHGRRHVGGHVGRRSFFSSRHPFSSSTREIASQICNFVPCSRFTERYLLDFFLSSSNLRVVNLSLSLSFEHTDGKRNFITGIRVYTRQLVHDYLSLERQWL